MGATKASKSGTAALVAIAMAVAMFGAVSGQAVEDGAEGGAPPQASDASPPQAFRGLVTDDGADVTGPPEDPRVKDDFGPVSTPSGDTPDVTGDPSSAANARAPVEDATVISPADASSDSAATLRRALRAAGDVATPDVADDGVASTIRVVVYMDLVIRAEGGLSAADRAAQRAAIARSMRSLERTLAGTASTVTPYDVVPAAVVSVDAAGLEALLADESVASIRIDEAYEPLLDLSTGVIDSDRLNVAGVLGNNYEGAIPGDAYEIAILDSGVRLTHAGFGTRVLDGACYSQTGWCPNGSTSQFGAAAGAHCTYTTGSNAVECQHGTHVAGIAAGVAFPGGHEGVAGGATIFSGQVGHRSCSFPDYCWRYFFSDLDQMLTRVIAERNAGRNIIAANMSLGGPLSGVNATCDATFPATQALFATMDSLGIAPIAAAGNNGQLNRTTYPACLSGAYAVSATNDVDNIAGFSDRSTQTDWWAPGVDITAPGSTSNGAILEQSGTSMAAPHVAGAFALLRECIGNSSDELVAADLDATGVGITSSGVTRPRINVLDAATRNVNNNDFSSPEELNGDGPFDDYDYNVCADAEDGELGVGGGSKENTIWWRFRPTTTGTFEISTNDGGGNVTTFDTQLSVFTGTSLATIQEIAYDDDGGDGQRSRVVIPLTGGQEYRIRVDGFGGANGLVNLHVERTGPAPSCSGQEATIVGSDRSETIKGTGADDVIVALAGDDVVNGRGGADLICLGDGSDVGNGQSGADTIRGGKGPDTIKGSNGSDTLGGNAGNDRLFGGNGGDRATGHSGSDTVKGQAGPDVLKGNGGNDRVLGGPSADRLSGGGGSSDYCHGNAGRDRGGGGCEVRISIP